MKMMMTKREEYNKEPVYYCKSCLKLSVINEGHGSYCNDCGCSSIGCTSIEWWEKAYRERYKKDYLTGYDIPYEECEHC